MSQEQIAKQPSNSLVVGVISEFPINCSTYDIKVYKLQSINFGIHLDLLSKLESIAAQRKTSTGIIGIKRTDSLSLISF